MKETSQMPSSTSLMPILCSARIEHRRRSAAACVAGWGAAHAAAKETDDLRILDFNGDRIFGLFRFAELAEPVFYDAESGSPIVYDCSLRKSLAILAMKSRNARRAAETWRLLG
jgi:hypothetical protein